MQERSVRARQNRSIKTEQSLLDALERLLEDRPFNEITVAAVAAEAGVTTGAIYRHFRDKEVLLHGAFNRFLERTRAETELLINAESEEGNLANLDVAIDGTIRYTLANIHLMRAASHLNDDTSFELLRTARNMAADELAARLSVPHVEDAELARRARFVLRMVTAVARDTFMAGPAARLPGIGLDVYQTRHHERILGLRNQLLDMAAAYIGVSGSR